MSVQLDDAHIHMSQEAFNIPGAIPFLDKRSRNSKKTIVTFFIKPVLTDNHYNTLCLLKHDTKAILNSINKMKEHYTENEQLVKAMKSISSHLDKATSILSQIIEHND